MVILMPLEIECHTVPHLKALTRGIDYTSGHGHGSAFSSATEKPTKDRK